MRTEILLGKALDKILSESIEQERIIELNREPTPFCWQIAKAHMLSGSPDEGIQISKPIVKYGNPHIHFDEMSINFRFRHNKFIFQSNYNDPGMISWPSEIIQARRKLYTREIPPTNTIVRFWKSGTNNQRPIYATLQDLSCSGMGVITRRGEYEGRYICSIDLEQPLIFDAIVRTTEPNKHQSAIGFQFVRIDLDPVKHLNRIGRVLAKWKRQNGQKRGGRNTPTSTFCVSAS